MMTQERLGQGYTAVAAEARTGGAGPLDLAAQLEAGSPNYAPKVRSLEWTQSLRARLRLHVHVALCIHNEAVICRSAVPEVALLYRGKYIVTIDHGPM